MRDEFLAVTSCVGNGELRICSRENSAEAEVAVRIRKRTTAFCQPMEWLHMEFMAGKGKGSGRIA
jgi:hypothetical protein